MQSFNEMRERLLAAPVRKRLGVVMAQDGHTLEAVSRAMADGLVEPVLFGNREAIASIWAEVSTDKLPRIVHCTELANCLNAVMKAVRSGELDCIMKGKLETGDLMKAVLNRETGIRKGDALSLIAMMDSPYYHKLFAVTDVGLMTYPTLSQKKAIIENAVGVFQSLGTGVPKVAVLAATEHVNQAMPQSVDAAALKEMNLQGELKGCMVEGPISYDLCMDPAAAALKGYESPVAGDPDILLVPDIMAGNILAKSLTCTGGAKTCGTVVGAQVPIIVTSRAAPAEDKYMSIVLSAVIGRLD